MSSKRRQRRVTCGRKNAHKTPEGAMVEIRYIRRVNPGTPRLNVYRCKFCNHYHVGHAKATGPRPH